MNINSLRGFMYIYLIVNHATGKYYVGQHKGDNLRKYLQQKFGHARKGVSKRSRLYEALRECPIEAFTIHALLSDIQTRPELDAYERDFIAFLKSQDPEYGYNICRGGEGFTGPHTEESRRKMSVAQHGRKVSPETIIKIKFALNTEECRKKLRDARLGRKRGPEAIANMCIAQQSRSHPELKPKPAKDMFGVIINGVAVMDRVSNTKSGKAAWHCRCRCGNTFNAEGTSLRNGHTKGCGCTRGKHTETHL